MKKKLIWVVGILTTLVLLATLIGPGVILAAVRQPEPEAGYAYSGSFYDRYDDIREHLAELSGELGTELSSYAVDVADGLYIDSFYLPSSEEKTNLIVLTTGVHGMEGYIGAAMLDVFFWRNLSDSGYGKYRYSGGSQCESLRNEVLPPIQ